MNFYTIVKYYPIAVSVKKKKIENILSDSSTLLHVFVSLNFTNFFIILP